MHIFSEDLKQIWTRSNLTSVQADMLYQALEHIDEYLKKYNADALKNAQVKDWLNNGFAAQILPRCARRGMLDDADAFTLNMYVAAALAVYTQESVSGLNVEKGHTVSTLPPDIDVKISKTMQSLRLSQVTDWVSKMENAEKFFLSIPEIYIQYLPIASDRDSKITTAHNQDESGRRINERTFFIHNITDCLSNINGPMLVEVFQQWKKFSIKAQDDYLNNQAFTFDGTTFKPLDTFDALKKALHSADVWTLLAKQYFLEAIQFSSRITYSKPSIIIESPYTQVTLTGNVLPHSREANNEYNKAIKLSDIMSQVASLCLDHSEQLFASRQEGIEHFTACLKPFYGTMMDNRGDTLKRSNVKYYVSVFANVIDLYSAAPKEDKPIILMAMYQLIDQVTPAEKQVFLSAHQYFEPMMEAINKALAQNSTEIVDQTYYKTARDILLLTASQPALEVLKQYCSYNAFFAHQNKTYTQILSYHSLNETTPEHSSISEKLTYALKQHTYNKLMKQTESIFTFKENLDKIAMQRAQNLPEQPKQQVTNIIQTENQQMVDSTITNILTANEAIRDKLLALGSVLEHNVVKDEVAVIAHYYDEANKLIENYCQEQREDLAVDIQWAMQDLQKLFTDENIQKTLETQLNVVGTEHQTSQTEIFLRAYATALYSCIHTIHEHTIDAPDQAYSKEIKELSQQALNNLSDLQKTPTLHFNAQETVQQLQQQAQQIQAEQLIQSKAEPYVSKIIEHYDDLNTTDVYKYYAASQDIQPLVAELKEVITDQTDGIPDEQIIAQITAVLDYPTIKETVSNLSTKSNTSQEEIRKNITSRIQNDCTNTIMQRHQIQAVEEHAPI